MLLYNCYKSAVHFLSFRTQPRVSLGLCNSRAPSRSQKYLTRCSNERHINLCQQTWSSCNLWTDWKVSLPCASLAVIVINFALLCLLVMWQRCDWIHSNWARRRELHRAIIGDSASRRIARRSTRKNLLVGEQGQTAPLHQRVVAELIILYHILLLLILYY